MDTGTYLALGIEVLVGVVLAVLGWSLRSNVASFARKLDEVAKDVRAVAMQAGAHETRIAVLDTRLTTAEGRIAGLEDRERRLRTGSEE